MPSPLASEDPPAIGDYELVGRLGVGGMGVVYLARTQRGAPVAVKTVRAAHADDAEFQARFRRELDATLRVGGTYVAQVIDADLDHDPPYFVTEFIPGDTLEERINREGPLDGEELTALAAGVAAGIAQIHRAGVAHRDISPRNVVLSPEGPKIIDLGIAHTRDATRITRTGVSVGTPSWMAPEHAQSEDVGQPADVFAWASVILYAATGRPPFGTGRAEAVMYRIVHEQPDTSGLSQPLRSQVDAALNKEPDARPSAVEVAAALTGSEVDVGAAEASATTMLLATRLIQHSPEPPTPPSDTGPVSSDVTTEAVDPGQQERSGARARRRTAVVAGAIVVAGLLAAAAFVWEPWTTADISDETQPAAAQTDTGSTATSEPSPSPTNDPSDATPHTPSPAPPAVDGPDEQTDAEQPPRPTQRDAPWDTTPVAPQAPGEQRAAQWWSEWMSDDDCGLYLPTGLENDNNLTLDGPTATRMDDVHLLWFHEDGSSFGLTIIVMPTYSDAADRYFQNEPAVVFSDGSELYADDSGTTMDRLLALPGENCFYEISAESMVALSWGIEGLRPIELP